MYFLNNGFDQLKTVQQKKFAKDLHGLLVSYYRQRKESVKNKQKRLLGQHPQHVRYLLKATLFSLLTSNNYAKCVKRIQPAYEQIKQSLGGPSSKSFEEKRQTADVLAVIMMKMMLAQNLTVQCIEFWRLHFNHF